MNAHRTDRELVEFLRYPHREWSDREPQWRLDTAPDQWVLFFNQMDFGAVSCEKRGDHWDGHYTWFLKSRLKKFPQTVEEGKQWLEAFFREWAKAFVCAPVTCFDSEINVENAIYRKGEGHEWYTPQIEGAHKIILDSADRLDTTERRIAHGELPQALSNLVALRSGLNSAVDLLTGAMGAAK